jgi:hypothetical protein
MDRRTNVRLDQPVPYDPLYTRGTLDVARRAGWNFGWRSAIWPDGDKQTIDAEDEARRGVPERRSTKSK